MTTDTMYAILHDPSFPRGYYARAVLDGSARLSGADLKGNARHWGAWYASVRARVMRIAATHGVTVVKGEHGRLGWSE